MIIFHLSKISSLSHRCSQKQKSKVARVPSNDGPKPSGRTGGSKADSGYVGTDPEAPVATVSAVECIIDEGHEAAKPKKPSSARGGSADRASVERSGSSKGRRDEKKAAVEKPTDDGKESEPKRNAASDYQSQKEREKEIIRRQMAEKKRSLGERAASKNALKVEKAKEPGLEKERGAAPAPGEKKRSPVLEEKRASQRVRSADKAKANAAEVNLTDQLLLSHFALSYKLLQWIWENLLQSVVNLTDQLQVSFFGRGLPNRFFSHAVQNSASKPPPPEAPSGVSVRWRCCRGLPEPASSATIQSGQQCARQVVRSGRR